ncbi:uncharacterized protein LOC142761363 isoform X2 [Rhinoderma darwinii]|uniref:uncharacterized protein LOC142761363 isoform X2 n=1 Tax=Rhinoderma darwinii TaxID=43563 RepID=UPI003F672562
MFAMRPCWLVYQLLLLFVLGGNAYQDYFWNLGYNGDKTESHSGETDFHVEFNPSAVLAFVPARSCHLQFSGDHGTFSPPVFYGNIDVNLWCNWTVVAAPGKHIIIYITGFRTNKTCSENLDEIIFEGISSSVENTIVYACWNKHTHVFATEASAVSVVLLWRSFSNIGSNKYFEGRFYVFDDPVFGPNTDSRNCTLTRKQNISSSDVIQGPIPEVRPTAKSHLHYSAFPQSSPSKILNSSVPYLTEAHHSQEPLTEMETYKPTLTIEDLIATTVHENDTLRVTSTLTPTLSTGYSRSKSKVPAVTRSFVLGVYEGHTVLPIAEDLQPSHIVKLETMTHSIWKWKTTLSEFVTETPTLLSNSYQIANVNESQHLSITDFIEPSEVPHFFTGLATDPPEPSLIHVFNTDFPEPSLSSDISHFSELHTTKFTETVQFSIDQTTENMPNFSIGHAFEFDKILNVSIGNSFELPGTPSLSLTRYIEPTKLSNSNTVTDNAELTPAQQLTNNGDLPKMQHFSVVHTIGQSVVLNTAGRAQLQILTKLPSTINVVSHPKKTVSVYPWHVESSPPTPYPESLNNLPLKSPDDTSFTDTHASLLHGHVSEQPFIPTYGSSLHPHFVPTKPLNIEILGKTDLGKTDLADPDYVESFTPWFTPSDTAPPIFSPRIRSSILGLQIQMVHSTLGTTVEEPLDPSFPQSTAITSKQQIMLDSTVAFHPTPEIPTELIYSKSALVTEKIVKIATVNEHLSLKSLETQSVPTIEYKLTQSLEKPTKVLDLEATDSKTRISTNPISTPVSYLSFSEELLKGKTFSNTSEDIEPQGTPSQRSLLQPTDNSNVNITTIELISGGNETSTYSYHTNSDLDLHQILAGHPRGDFFDEQDVTYFFGNQSNLDFPHEPGDSLFVITTEIEHKDVVLRNFEKDLVESVREKITERMIYSPSGVNSLILKEIRWTNVNNVTLTFWLQLIQGGKEMRNFLKTQLKSLESSPLGSSNASLVSFTVEDVNECQLGIQNCHKNAHCVNMAGSYSCYCMEGYEDHSPAAPGTVCISFQFAEHLEILIVAVVTGAVTLLLVILILCIVQKKRRAKANFCLQDPITRERGAHLGSDRQSEIAQPLFSPTMHLSPRHGREHPTAREMSSTLELTKICIEQTAC